ncbi:MAG: DUF6323 family protein [Ignavibacteriales bacterium]
MPSIIKFTNLLSLNTLMKKEVVKEITDTNFQSRRYMLHLSEKDAVQIIESRNRTLNDTGRLELNHDIINKIIMTFCTSPYINQYDYTETICDLMAVFYYYKNETSDEIGDDDLIDYMKERFDGNCYGSLELLVNRELENLVVEIRKKQRWTSMPGDGPEDEV